MEPKNIVRVHTHATDWKDRLAGWHLFRVTGECVQCLAPVQLRLHGTRAQCERVDLVCDPCDIIASANEAAVREAFGVQA